MKCLEKQLLILIHNYDNNNNVLRFVKFALESHLVNEFLYTRRKTENENMRKYANMTRTWISTEQHQNNSSFFFHTFADVYCEIQTVFR